MDRNELFNQVNQHRREILLPPMQKEEYVAALSSLECKGLIETNGNEIVSKVIIVGVINERRNEFN